MEDKRDLDRALADFDELVQLDPSVASYHAARGNVQGEQGKLDDALESLDKAIRLAPNIGVFYSWRAYLWSAKGEHNNMIQDFEEGIRRSPENADCWTLRAWVLATSPIAEHRNGKQAIADATKACELTDWKNYNCLENLAAAYAEANDFAQAVPWQEKAVSMTPPGKRAEYESRLKLYREGKPYRDVPRSSP